MEFLSSLSPSFFLGIIGWAATYKLVSDSHELSVWQKRWLTVFTWLLWMVPAFDVTVYQGLMNTYTALLYGSVLTMVLLLWTTFNALSARSKK